MEQDSGGQGGHLSSESQPTLAGEARIWHTPNAADGWIPDTITENTMRRGEGPEGSLRSTTGSLAKQVANQWPTPYGFHAGNGPDGNEFSSAVRKWPTPAARAR